MKICSIFFCFALFVSSQSTDCSLFGCVKCSENDPNVCIECFESLVLYKNRCKSLGILPSTIPFCAEYFTSTLCKSCDADHALINNTCISEPKNKSSSELSSSDNKKRQLFTCSLSNCLSCSANDYCASCNLGFYERNGECICYCPDNCESCYSPCSSCESCYSSYSLTVLGCDSGSNSCSDINCLSCPSYNTCDSCKIGGFGIDGNCYCFYPDHCENSTSCQFCLACEAGYQLNSNRLCEYQPITCSVSNCMRCSTVDYCSRCATGYDLLEGICSRICTDHCSNCSIDNSTCYNCEAGYQLNSYSLCDYKSLCEYQPITCSDSNCLNCSTPDCCKKCMNDTRPDTFSIKQEGKCHLTCLNRYCFACSPYNNCTTCETWYKFISVASIYKSQNTVSLCKYKKIICSDSNCISCSTADYCSSCATGYSLLEGICSCSCTGHCSSCSIDCSTCYACDAGYQLNIYSLCENKPIICSDSNCISCSTADICTKCVEDPGTPRIYSLEAGKCHLNCFDRNCLTCSPYNQCTTCKTGLN